jgi:hypothetical protein
MSQPNSGPIELKVDDMLIRIHDELNKFNDKHGLKIRPDGDISIYLNMPEKMLREMSADEAGSAAYMVSRHAAYVKQQYNREQAIIKWTRTTLNRLAVTHAPNYQDSKFLKLEEKVALVAADNEYAREVERKLLAAEIKASELYDMHSQLNRITDTLIEIQRTKRSERFNKQ